eukprot:6197527-Pleurochrysis_carterae.AAC.1
MKQFATFSNKQVDRIAIIHSALQACRHGIDVQLCSVQTISSGPHALATTIPCMLSLEKVLHILCMEKGCSMRASVHTCAKREACARTCTSLPCIQYMPCTRRTQTRSRMFRRASFAHKGNLANAHISPRTYDSVWGSRRETKASTESLLRENAYSYLPDDWQRDHALLRAGTMAHVPEANALEFSTVHYPHGRQRRLECFTGLKGKRRIRMVKRMDTR